MPPFLGVYCRETTPGEEQTARSEGFSEDPADDEFDGVSIHHLLICLIDLQTVRVAHHRLDLGHGVVFRVGAAYSREASRK